MLQAKFGLEFDLTSGSVTVERTPDKSNKVFIMTGAKDNWIYTPEVNKAGEQPSLSNSQWRNVLGDKIFKLDQETQTQSWGPKFRSMFSYFVRSENAGAFRSPVRQSVKQQRGDEQVALMFLLGLDWTIPRELQLIRERERGLRELRKAASAGTLGPIIGTRAQLRTVLTVTEEKARVLADQLKSYRVLPQYRQFEADASNITRQLAGMSDANTMDHELLDQLEEAVNREVAPPTTDVESVFKEAGVELPGSVKKRFDDVRTFHESVVQNRKSYLEGEITRVRDRIASRDKERVSLDSRRSELMVLLNTHGALEHFSNLQNELIRLRTEAETYRQQYKTAEQLESQKTELQSDRNRIYQRLRQDFTEQQDTVKRAILAFERVSSRLYEEAGRLTLRETEDGPEFEVTIQGARSVGINKMQIFCFDMMLMQLCAERGIGPNFLVHDSHLFDGVDERQVANALHQGAKLAEEWNFQYIVTMNSDDMPPDSLFPDDFKISEYILPIRLTDKTEDGGLFGFRFD
ncbi:ABC-three component system protein [Chloroflexota bacterium]